MLIFVLNGCLKAASELIKASVEPVIEQYRPVILASLKFSKFTLGTVAPQFTGFIWITFFLMLVSIISCSFSLLNFSFLAHVC